MSQNYLSIITKFTPISPNDTILKKRFYKEMTCLYDTKWQHYFIQITYNRIFVCQFKLTLGYQLLIKIPTHYPYKGPDYMIKRHSRNIVINKLYSQLPEHIVTYISAYLHHPKEVMLKQFLYEYLLYYHREQKKAEQIMSDYELTMSPYKWSPGQTIGNQLSNIKTLIEQVGLTYKKNI